MNLHDLNSIKLEAVPDLALLSLKELIKLELKKRGRYKSFRTEKRNSLVKNRHHSINSPLRNKCLADVLMDDWSSVYPATRGSEEKKFYVYAHVDPIAGELNLGDMAFNGLPFYIGKGTGERAFDLKRNEGHGVELKILKDLGLHPESIVQIIKSGMTEQEAYCFEAKLIHFFGTRFDGVKNGLLVNLTKPPTPYD